MIFTPSLLCLGFLFFFFLHCKTIVRCHLPPLTPREEKCSRQRCAFRLDELFSCFTWQNKWRGLQRGNSWCRKTGWEDLLEILIYLRRDRRSPRRKERSAGRNPAGDHAWGLTGQQELSSNPLQSSTACLRHGTFSSLLSQWAELCERPETTITTWSEQSHFASHKGSEIAVVMHLLPSDLEMANVCC